VTSPLSPADAAVGVVVRSARDDDADAIEAVLIEAFEPDDRPAALVRALRASAAHVRELELVAERGGLVVGHVVLSRAHVVDATRARHPVLALSPLSVRVAVQRTGIGGALVLEALSRADAAGEPLVTVEGHPSYYPRFGFGLARELGVTMALPNWAPPEAAMARLRPGTETGPQGRLEYPAAFETVLEEEQLP
jgi:putative acetyltransferase